MRRTLCATALAATLLAGTALAQTGTGGSQGCAEISQAAAAGIAARVEADDQAIPAPEEVFTPRRIFPLSMNTNSFVGWPVPARAEKAKKMSIRKVMFTNQVKHITPMHNRQPSNASPCPPPIARDFTGSRNPEHTLLVQPSPAFRGGKLRGVNAPA